MAWYATTFVGAEIESGFVMVVLCRQMPSVANKPYNEIQLPPHKVDLETG